MTTPPAPKPLRIHPVLIGIVAIGAAVGIAGIAAYFVIPAPGPAGPAGVSASPNAPDTPGPSAPRGIRRVEAQQTAMEALFSLARNRQQTGLTTPLADADKRAVVAAVDTAADPATDPLDRQGLIWMFARTCAGYRFVVAGGVAPPAGPYAPVFDAAFWEAAQRLANTPGTAAAGFLVQLARPLTDARDQKRMNALLHAQRAVKNPSPVPTITPTPPRELGGRK